MDEQAVSLQHIRHHKTGHSVPKIIRYGLEQASQNEVNKGWLQSRCYGFAMFHLKFE